jgi:hypothetical protein
VALVLMMADQALELCVKADAAAAAGGTLQPLPAALGSPTSTALSAWCHLKFLVRTRRGLLLKSVPISVPVQAPDVRCKRQRFSWSVMRMMMTEPWQRRALLLDTRAEREKHRGCMLGGSDTKMRLGAACEHLGSEAEAVLFAGIGRVKVFG